ncbi:hypothetical protein AWM75_03195 [Aerococcus urinaehominis]|uniref:Uncharacterized protein n=1 Tax=Aerococcus urinaehominis TaxID=128944 RepID=A0A109RGV5_9LACT|nr:galactokinase family protein [Aerococcus urinaehominis]AMB99066.1 hypothetical protein AWM75_03195 [Aerococcus urinaehominis]SDM59689.1 galactokinase [Aerococcus urinaehominis]
MLHLKEEFAKRYHSDDIRAVRSPLRIAPIGAHSDFQNGRALGLTINASVDMVYAPSDDGYIQVNSMDFPDKEYFHLKSQSDYIPGFWGNYIRGAVMAIQEDHVLKKGIKGVVSGKLPIGGLSSSAAVTTAYLMALCDVNNIEFSKLDLIRWSHWVEREFIGLKNGIMDQAANILSEDNKILLMDCEDWTYDLIDKGASMPEFEVVIVFSGISKQLIGTDFNNRVDETRVAGWLLLDRAGEDKLPTLADVRFRHVPEAYYEAHRDQIPDRFGKRADHYYSEQKRVLAGAEAWAAGDLDRFGQLMFESGASSFYQYETGIPEMHEIYQILKTCPGVYGARPSGAGFRGAVIGLIDPAYKEQICQAIDDNYPQKYPEIKDRYEVNFARQADGAHFLDLEEVN